MTHDAHPHPQNGGAETSRRISRRRLLQYAGGAFVLGAAGVPAWTFLVEPHFPDVERVRLPIANVPSQWIGRRIVQLSDLHAGPVVDSEYLRGAMRRVGAMKPDMVVITGDFMSCHGTEQVHEAASVVAELTPAPPLGIFAVMGNHDYGAGWQRVEVAHALEEELRPLGVRFLRNADADVDGLRLIGADDYWGPNFSPARVMEKVRGADPALVLCHNPDAADERGVWGDYRGWILAGHTHGGQCKPPFLPPPILPVANKQYTEGRIEAPGGRTVYINRGTGYLRKVRFNARPEITLFTIQDAANARPVT